MGELLKIINPKEMSILLKILFKLLLLILSITSVITCLEAVLLLVVVLEIVQLGVINAILIFMLKLLLCLPFYTGR